MKPKKILSSFLIPVLVFSGCASSGGTKTQSRPAISAPLADEVALGEKIHAQILSSFYPYTEPTAAGYINQIGASLAAHARRRNLPYRFTILYNDKIYATSSPGGFVYLTTGLIRFLDNESEIAAVMAHEIGELQYQDPRLSQSRKILDAVTRGGAAVGPAFGSVGALAVLGLMMMNAIAEAGQLTPAQRLHKADAEALHYMTEAGYDPQGLIDVLYRFLNADPALVPFFYDYQQSRPITMDRFQALQAEFDGLPLQGKTFSTGRDTYQEMTKGIQEIYRR